MLGVDAAASDLQLLVLKAVEQVLADLGQHRPPGGVSLDSRLAGDLSLDSLSVAEVLTVLESELGISLPSALLASAETPGDLLRAVSHAGARVAPLRGRADELGAASQVGIPAAAATLVEVLDWYSANQPDRVHLRLLGDDGQEEAITYADLRASAVRVAGGLVSDGLSPGETVALMLPTCVAYFEAFMGVLLAGGVPVPIYPPARPSQIEDHLRRHARLLSNAGAALLITDAPSRRVAHLLRSAVGTMRAVATVETLSAGGGGGGGGGGDLVRPAPEAMALIQYTSGSTGNPKGVVLSHANLLANIAAMGQAAEATPEDSFVSWLPLYHDMGLIGAWMAPLCLGMPAVIMSPLAFLARPARWLAAIDAYRGTLTAAPNFGYELCVRKVTDTEIEGLDLSSVRMALNGAEPVAAATMESFAHRFARCGLHPEALAPVYGLAESALALTFPPLGRGVLVDAVDAASLRRTGQAVPAAAGQAATMRVVACGRPLPGYEVRVVDDAGRELGERTEGQIEFRGPSATSGYYRNPQATATLFHDGWVSTGDLGYETGGDLYVTGRSKDLIIRAGHNLHPEELETALGDVPGVRKGCVAAFASPDPKRGTERLVVIAETHETDDSAREEIRSRIVAATADLLGTPPDEVVLAAPATVLKTSSGKIRRAATSDLYERGRIGARPAPPWWQLARFAAVGVQPALRRRLRAVSALGYAAYCWILIAAVGLPTLAALAVMPVRSWRRRLVRFAARSLRALSGTSLEVQGTRLPTVEPCVVVANHASWLDAPLLASWLPPEFTFVAGGVLGRQHLTGFLLRRIGTEFVEPGQPGRALADTARLSRLAAQHALVFFPEGGLARAPGLRPFHMGAFVAATQAGRPVVPIAMRGSRSMLRAGQRFVRRGAITIVIGEPIGPVGDDWPAALQLQRQARATILRHCAEPDLA